MIQHTGAVLPTQLVMETPNIFSFFFILVAVAGVWQWQLLFPSSALEGSCYSPQLNSLKAQMLHKCNS